MRVHVLLSWIAATCATTVVATPGAAAGSVHDEPVTRAVPGSALSVPPVARPAPRGAAVTWTPTPAARAEAEAAPLTCVRVSAEARYRGLGYEHVVHLENGCDKAVVCLVATNVNPEPQTVSVPPGVAADVVTFIGSPSREFVPHVTCTAP